MNTSRYRRPAFTLIEMIVVITIMLFLAALGTAFLPKFLDNQMQTRAVDQLSQWLLTAKQRAKRDGVPTGLRILADPTTGLATQLEYVQQPDPYTGGWIWKVNGNGDGTATFYTPNDPTAPPGLNLPGIDLEGAGLFSSQWLVQPGDYLELNGGGHTYLIQGVSSTRLHLVNTEVTIANPTPNYRIIRQPRRMLGEDVMTLPQDMVIDASPNPSNGNIPYSLNVPQRQVAGSSTVYEVLFAPSGAVIGQGTPSGKIVLWVRNATKQATDPGSATLVTIQIRTGFIAAHPISLSGDYYQFTEDGRSSGM